MNRLGVALLLAAGVFSLWWQSHGLTPYISNDSYQYIDAAAEVSSGECLCTRLAHFDEQVEPGRFPVAFTHFPPGYPLLLASVTKLGMSPEKAGALISALGYLLTLSMIWSISQGLGGSIAISLAVGLLWVLHATALSTASMVATEEPFIAALMLLAAAIVRDVRTKGAEPKLLLAITLLAGSSYWLRYTGLFILPVAGSYVLWRAWLSRTIALAAVSLALLASMMLSLQIRNIHYTGSWRGGFTAGESHKLSWVLTETVKAFYHLVFGDRVVAHVDLWSVLFLGSAGILLWLTIQSFRQRSSSGTGIEAAWLWLAILGAAYTAGITLAALTSIAADFTRYYLPLYPLLLTAFAAGVSRLPSSLWRAVGLSGVVLAVLAIESRSLNVEPGAAPHLIVNAALDQPLANGSTAKEWLLAHTQSQDVIVSVNGQPVHYLLHRPVVSILEPQFSGHREDEPYLQTLMMKFHSRYLVVFPGMDKFAPSQEGIPFLADLARGSANPEWLSNAARGNAVSIWECAKCAN